MATRLEWANISPFRAVLYQVEDDNPRNKKVASIEYDHEARSFSASVYHSEVPSVLFDIELDLATKQEAMESAMAMLVTRRFTESN